jgi:hypothetical protein
MLRDSIRREERKNYIDDMLNRARSQVSPLNPRLVSEYDNRHRLINNIKRRETPENIHTNIDEKVKTPMSNKQTKSFIPDSDKVKSELLDIKETISKTLAEETFNTRKLLIKMNNNMKELRADIFNRIDLAEHKNRLNMETMKIIFEQGGNSKLRKVAREAFGGKHIYIT